jgi:purine-binding chemotaxis protein CheW
VTTPDPPRVLATFRAGGRHFALAAGDVREVVAMPALLPALDPPGWVAGVLDLRGRMIPVVDLRVLLGLEALERGVQTPLVVVRSPTGEVGLIVDALGDVVSYDHASCSRALPAAAGYREAVVDAVRIGTDLILVLDPAWLTGNARGES